jgi:hypothetical protein
MLQIYTSPRIENVERLVAVLGEHGIAAKVRNHEAWRAAGWKRFSYSERGDRHAWPQAWVLHAEDYTRARQLLREVGLEPSTRFADELAAARSPGDTARHRAASWRWKLVILALIVAVVLMAALRLAR